MATVHDPHVRTVAYTELCCFHFNDDDDDRLAVRVKCDVITCILLVHLVEVCICVELNYINYLFYVVWLFYRLFCLCVFFFHVHTGFLDVFN